MTMLILFTTYLVIILRTHAINLVLAQLEDFLSEEVWDSKFSKLLVNAKEIFNKHLEVVVQLVR